MKCVFCGGENIGYCCDRAALDKALIALQHHVECNCDEAAAAIDMAKARMKHHG